MHAQLLSLENLTGEGEWHAKPNRLEQSLASSSKLTSLKSFPNLSAISKIPSSVHA